jgi:hypothetical protein
MIRQHILYNDYFYITIASISKILFLGLAIEEQKDNIFFVLSKSKPIFSLTELFDLKSL